MDALKIGELFSKLKPRIIDLISIVGGGTGPFAPTPHDLNSAHHTGTIADAQATQFLKTDGTRQLSGNLPVANGITIDGVDLSEHAGSVNAHHEPVTITDSSTIDLSLSGQQLSASVIQSGLDHGSIGGLADDDHSQYYNAGRHTLALHTGLGLVANTRQIISGNGLTGGGDLSADRTLAVGAGTGITVGADDVGIDLAANLTWGGDHVFQGGLSTRHLLPEQTDTYDLGSSTLLWRKGWLSELDSVLFAQNTITLLGGWFVVGKGEGSLPEDVGSADTSIDFGQSMTTGQFVVIRSSLQVEYIQIGSLVSGTTYNVTRNLDGSGANDWVAGTVFLILGVNGDGRIELNAYDTPRISILEQGATYNAQTERIRIGDLAAWQGAGFTGYGIAIGNYSGGESLVYSPAGGLEVRGTIKADDGYLQNLTVQGLLSLNTSGELRAGDTTNGLRFGYLTDGYYLRGVGGGVTQVEIKASDGKLYAGGGQVQIDSVGISLKNKTTSGSKEDASSIKVYDYAGANIGELAIWRGVNVVEWEFQELRRFGGGGSPTYISISDNVIINNTLCVYSTITGWGGISVSNGVRAGDTIQQVRSDGAIIPLLPVAPWTACAKSYSYWYANFNPLRHPGNTMMDESYLARHLTANVAGHSTTFNTPKSISDYQLYYSVNSTNQYYENAYGSYLNNQEWVTLIMWFYPTTIRVLQGLFRFGMTTANCLAYVTSVDKVVFEIIDTTNTTGQIISSNTINLNKWNYAIFRYIRTGDSYINLNGTTTTVAHGLGYLRTATGNFRLGYDSYGGHFNGALGWCAFGGYQANNTIDALLDMSKPWHGH